MNLTAFFILATVAAVAQNEDERTPPRPTPAAQSASEAAAPIDAGLITLRIQAIAAPLLDDGARQISFQALLTNDQGGPINIPNGQHELDFRIYSTPVGGVAIGSVLNVLVTLDHGIASTMIGPLDGDWFDGSPRWLGVTVDNGAELAPRVQLGAAPYAFRVDRVASEELDDQIELGASNTAGSLALYADTSANSSLFLDGQTATARIGSSSAGAPAGNLHLFPTTGAPSRIHLNGQEGDLRLGFSGTSSGDLRLYSTAAGIERIHLDGANGHVVVTDGVRETIRLDGSGGGGGGGILLWNSAGGQTVEVDGDETDHGALRLSNASGTTTVELEAQESVGGPGGQLVLRNAAGAAAIVLDAEIGTGGAGVITTTGSLGIGTSNPNHELVVQGNDPVVQVRDDTTDNSANAARLELLERAGGAFDGGAFFWWNGETNKLLLGTKSSGVNTNVLVIDRATNSVGIGTQTPGDYRLAVNGAIRAKEIVVETGWSDFVFEPDYKLPSLEDVETHIQEHGHLPAIPSAADVEKNGVKLGEMDSKLLQKIEEMTLHLIAINKRVKALEEENAKLSRMLSQREPAERRAE